MNSVLYSIITINYNNCAGLRHTIESVVNQTYEDYEYIVIDGCSTDDSVDVIKSYSDKVTYWVSEKDRGIYHAMNKGVAQAHGDYCIFMNSGDCFHDINVLMRITSSCLTEDIIVGNVLSAFDGKILFEKPSREISLYYLYSATVPHQSSFIRTELLRQFPYDEDLTIVSDWKFFIQVIILLNCSVKYVNENVALFDTSGVSTSNPNLMWKEKEQVLRSMFPPRVLADYQNMKLSECLTQTLTPKLRRHYGIDKFIYKITNLLLKLLKE